MTKFLIAAIIVLVAASCSARVVKRQAGGGEYYQPQYQPQPQPQPLQQQGGLRCNGEGAQPNPNDCSTYLNCYQGSVAVSNCPFGLEFNPNIAACDFPEPQAPNYCQRTLQPQGCIASSSNVNISQSYFVGHPDFCNAFYHCGRGFRFGTCIFCAGGTYFNPGSGRCTAYRSDQQANSCVGGQGAFVDPLYQEFVRARTCSLQDFNLAQQEITAGYYPNQGGLYQQGGSNFQQGGGSYQQGGNPQPRAVV